MRVLHELKRDCPVNHAEFYNELRVGGAVETNFQCAEFVRRIGGDEFAEPETVVEFF